jgi:VanZ family protein
MKSSASAPTHFALWAPVLFYAALIYFLSSVSFHFPWFQNAQKSHADKLVHVVEYSVFGILLCRALGAQSFFKSSAGLLFMAVVLAGALYGASDEFHQSFVPNRDSSPVDVMADTVGSALGCWAWLRKVKRENA